MFFLIGFLLRFTPTFHPSRQSDYLICSRQYIRWNRQADLLGRFQIDHEFEFDRLLDRQLGGFSSLEDLVYVIRGAA